MTGEIEIKSNVPIGVSVCGGKMGITISQALTSLEPCFYARSIVKMALIRILTEKHSSDDEFNREIVILILTPQTLHNVHGKSSDRLK